MKKLTYLLSLVLLALVVGPALGALPLTRSTTYVAGTTPAIKAADLNDMQDYLAFLYAGTRSVKGLTADGTGGNLVTAPSGSVVTSRTTAGSGAAGCSNCTTALVAGELTRGLTPLCWAVVTDAGALARGVNVYSVNRTADPGEYRVVCHSTPADPANVAPAITVFAAASPRIATAFGVNVGGRAGVDVDIFDTAGARQNHLFQIVVYGE